MHSSTVLALTLSQDHQTALCRRFSVYPQVLTLRLEGPARLAQIQLLSHESKIAEKVELQVGIFASANGGGTGGLATLAPAPTNADPDKATWRKLGHLNFDSNEQSNFTARELKSVAMPPNTVAHLVRLVFHGCHPNATNMYGQVRSSQRGGEGAGQAGRAG